MRAVFPASVVAALFAVPAAHADPATSEGARQLSRTAAAYFGEAAVEHGLIAITPQGDGYLATIDLQRAIDAFELPPDVRLAGRSSLVLTPIADGAWNVSADDFPTIVLDVGPQGSGPSFSLNASGFHFHGVFDPSLAAFRESKASADSVDFKMRAFDRPTDQPREFAFHYGAATVWTAGQAAGESGVTIGVRERIDSGQNRVSEPAANDSPAGSAATNYDIQSLVGEGSIEGLRTATLADLWRFLVAHLEHRGPEQPSFQTALKRRILAALPLWDRISATATIQDATVQTSGAKIAMRNAAESVAMSGLAARGSLGFGVNIGALSVESPLLPAWAGPLTPTVVDFDVMLSAAGIDKIIRVAIDEFDADATPPLPADSRARMGAMLMNGDPKLTIAHGRLTSPDLDLAFQGAFALSPPRPSGKLEISADNLDKTLAVIGKAAESDPALQKTMLGLTLMKGLARTDASGKLNWEIALDAAGAVSVNGAAMPTNK